MLGVDLDPIGGEDNTPLLRTEPSVFQYAIGWYSFYTRPCTLIPEGEEGGINPPNLGFNAKPSLAPLFIAMGLAWLFVLQFGTFSTVIQLNFQILRPSSFRVQYPI